MPTVSKVSTVQAPTMTQPKYTLPVALGLGGWGAGAWGAVSAVMVGEPLQSAIGERVLLAMARKTVHWMVD